MEIKISKFNKVNQELNKLLENSLLDSDIEYGKKRQKILKNVLNNIYMPYYKDNMSFYYTKRIEQVQKLLNGLGDNIKKNIDGDLKITELQKKFFSELDLDDNKKQGYLGNLGNVNEIMERDYKERERNIVYKLLIDDLKAKKEELQFKGKIDYTKGITVSYEDDEEGLDDIDGLEDLIMEEIRKEMSGGGEADTDLTQDEKIERDMYKILIYLRCVERRPLYQFEISNTIVPLLFNRYLLGDIDNKDIQEDDIIQFSRILFSETVDEMTLNTYLQNGYGEIKQILIQIKEKCSLKAEESIQIGIEDLCKKVSTTETNESPPFLNPNDFLEAFYKNNEHIIKYCQIENFSETSGSDYTYVLRAFFSHLYFESYVNGNTVAPERNKDFFESILDTDDYLFNSKKLKQNLKVFEFAKKINTYIHDIVINAYNLQPRQTIFRGGSLKKSKKARELNKKRSKLRVKYLRGGAEDAINDDFYIEYITRLSDTVDDPISKNQYSEFLKNSNDEKYKDSFIKIKQSIDEQVGLKNKKPGENYTGSDFFDDSEAPEEVPEESPEFDGFGDDLGAVPVNEILKTEITAHLKTSNPDLLKQNTDTKAFKKLQEERAAAETSLTKAKEKTFNANDIRSEIEGLRELLEENTGYAEAKRKGEELKSLKIELEEKKNTAERQIDVLNSELDDVQKQVNQKTKELNLNSIKEINSDVKDADKEMNERELESNIEAALMSPRIEKKTLSLSSQEGKSILDELIPDEDYIEISEGTILLLRSPFAYNIYKFIKACDMLKSVKKWRLLVCSTVEKLLNMIPNIDNDTSKIYTLPAYNHFNIVLMGTPGIGKSFTSKYVGEALKYSGLLPNGEIMNIKKPDIIGSYTGQTTPKVYNRFTAALGKVAFVDEAYSIAGAKDQTKGTYNEFGQEAIDAITDFTSEHVGLLAVVAAGYENEMREQFLEVNVGIKRRFPPESNLILNRYDNKDLWTILKLYIKNILKRAKDLKVGNTKEIEDYHRACMEVFMCLFNYQKDPAPQINLSENIENWIAMGKYKRAVFTIGGNPYLNLEISSGSKAEFDKSTYFDNLEEDTGEFLKGVLLYHITEVLNGDLFRNQSANIEVLAEKINDEYIKSLTTGVKELGEGAQAQSDIEKFFFGARGIEKLYYKIFFTKNPNKEVENISYESPNSPKKTYRGGFTITRSRKRSRFYRGGAEESNSELREETTREETTREVDQGILKFNTNIMDVSLSTYSEIFDEKGLKLEEIEEVLEEDKYKKFQLFIICKCIDICKKESERNNMKNDIESWWFYKKDDFDLFKDEFVLKLLEIFESLEETVKNKKRKELENPEILKESYWSLLNLDNLNMFYNQKDKLKVLNLVFEIFKNQDDEFLKDSLMDYFTKEDDEKREKLRYLEEIIEMGIYINKNKDKLFDKIQNIKELFQVYNGFKFEQDKERTKYLKNEIRSSLATGLINPEARSQSGVQQGRDLARKEEEKARKEQSTVSVEQIDSVIKLFNTLFKKTKQIEELESEDDGILSSLVKKHNELITLANLQETLGGGLVRLKRSKKLKKKYY